MVGNLAEWCEDPDPTKGEGMALAAGGSWFDPPERCRAGLRLTLAVTARDPRVGVRLVVPFVPPTTDDRP
jgi:formylglycine-generating enzyme required for sulfatase activity